MIAWNAAVALSLYPERSIHNLESTKGGGWLLDEQTCLFEHDTASVK
jgi:hypothetical protein